MIKGVNKRVVEIISTNHEYFEKAVLFVKADKSCVPEERITQEAREYLNRIIPEKRKVTAPFAIKLSVLALVTLVLIALIYLKLFF